MNNKKIALVTGANKGIGLEVVRLLTQQKDITIILTSRNKKKGLEATEKLRKEGFQVDYHTLNVSDKESVEGIVRIITDKYGRLDILINNAGVLKSRDSILEMSTDDFDETMQINLFGAYYLCRAFIPLMLKNNYGRIVNVSSGYGAIRVLDSAEVGGYKLSKVALNNLTRLISSEVDTTIIKVNAADPGWVKTDMGGSSAPRIPSQAAKGIVWLATLPQEGPAGGFFFDGKAKEW